MAERQEVIADVVEDEAETPDSAHLGDLARAVAARTERRVERPVQIDDTNVIEVVARPRQIERAISNLVDNAVKYSRSGATIDIDIEGRGAR